MKRLATLFVILFFCIALTPNQDSADARGRSKLYFVQAKLPKKASERQLLRFAKRHQAKRMKEVTDKPRDERYWYGKMVVSFPKPPPTSEFQVLFYDLTEGHEFVSPEMSVYIGDRNMKTFVQKFKLERPNFKPNHKYEAVLLMRQKKKATRKFTLLGLEKKRSGKVEFGDDET